MKTSLVVLIIVGIFVIGGIFLLGSGNGGPTGNVVADGKDVSGKTSTAKPSGSIEIKGSDTIVELVSNLAEAYEKTNPNVRLSVTGGGSGTGIASLINGEIDIADASRPIKDEEKKEAADKGIGSYEFSIARDMLSVIVHDGNPVKALTTEQVAKIYKGEITNWKDVGGKDEKITLYGRQSTSGTYVFFMEHILKGDYSKEMKNMEGNQAILDAVRQDESGIGYVGIGYIVDDSGNKVDGIEVLKVNGISALEFDKINQYAVSRPLYQYFAELPKEGTAEYDFLMFELGEDGQNIVEKTGFVKLTNIDRGRNIALLR